MEKQQIEIEHDFDSKCPQAFICPITSIVMQDPYMDANGISYQKQAIFAWVRKTGRHPTAGRQMKLQQLNANLMLKDVINQYKQKFKDRVNYQINRNRFEISRLNFQAATKLQIQQLGTPGFQDSERKYKTNIKELQQMVEVKQINLQRLRKTATQNSIKLQELILQIKVLEEALKKSKQRQQELQQLNQKNHSLVTENQILIIKEKNLLERLAMQMSQKQMLKQELMIAQFKQRGGQQKMERQPQRERPNIRQQMHQQKQQLRHLKLTPDKQSRGLKQKEWVIDNTNSNVCIRNAQNKNIPNCLCSSALPNDGEFVFTIKVIQLTGDISIGLMEEGKKREKIGDNYNYCVYFNTLAQKIRRPNEQQTSSSWINCQCSKQLPKCPFQIECHVNRQQNTIAWHYDGKQQAKSILPKAWKTNQKSLCAVVWVRYKGDSVEMI